MVKQVSWHIIKRLNAIKDLTGNFFDLKCLYDGIILLAPEYVFDEYGGRTYRIRIYTERSFNVETMSELSELLESQGWRKIEISVEVCTGSEEEVDEDLYRYD